MVWCVLKRALAISLTGNRAFSVAEVFDDLALQGWEPADAFLIVRCEFIDHLAEWNDQGVDGVLGNELRKHEVDAVIATGEVMKGSHAGFPAWGGEEGGYFDLSVQLGDVS